MNKNKTYTFVLFALLITGGAWLLLSNNFVNQAPDISLNTINGERIALNQLQGKPVLLTFWATDCPGCIKEIPHLKALHRDYSTEGVNIIAVAMYYDRPDNVIAMSKEKNLPYKIALDPLAEASKAFGNVRLTPTTFLIAPNGHIVMQKIGEFDEQSMRERLNQLLQAS
ncbi:MAG: TlpA family protein disulfide reductase [Cycloclasticus sp.]|nr:TlpA family protein disulfide reductase [Cycloclasticus sp.]MBQ0790340.1 TlpA family protein disulfide reductase [Cycloclasticus sp.]